MYTKTSVKQAITRLSLAATLSLSCSVLQPSQAEQATSGDSKPIVDVSFDAPYRQVTPSMGDEWAPTWSRDDAMYTGSDDGDSFGGISPRSAFAVGKLVGNDPYQLKGVTVNGMLDFREPVQTGPETALWNFVGSLLLNNVRYRFVPCSTPSADRSNQSCLASLADGGKHWIGTPASHDEPLFRDEQFRSPSFISLSKDLAGGIDNKPGTYAYAASYVGEVNGEDGYIIGRVEKEKLAAANAADWSFQKAIGVWGTLAEAAPIENSGLVGPDGANWKATNSYSVDGVLYMFITRCSYPAGSSDPKRRHIFQNSSIIKSSDQGQHWERIGKENFEKPMFPGLRFGAPYFIWYGKDGAADVDNADRYVYAISNNGHLENGDDYVLGRVLRSKLPALTATDWSFYSGGDGMSGDNWSPVLDKAKPILENPNRSGMTGMTYVPSLRRYVMVSWYYHWDNFVQGIEKGDLGTVIEFFESPKPWGPWTKVKAFDTGKLGWFAPVIGQRFQFVVNSHSVTAFLYAPGFNTKSGGGLDMTLYKLNYMPVTLSTRPLKHKDPAFVGGVTQ